MQVKCKVNFIMGGRFIRIGSVMDMERIPQELRLKKYVEKIPDDVDAPSLKLVPDQIPPRKRRR